VPTGVFFILLGTLVVRGIGRHYELQIEEANARLEERVETRTAELQQTVKELTATRRALDLSEKMALLGQLVAGIAHEINNPLNVIAIQAENVRELATDEDEKRAADSIRRSAVRCGQLVQNLLAFARNDPPRRQPESMNDLVETCLAMAAGESQRYGVRMDLEFPHGDVEVSIDRIQIEQVLLNLIGNAAQALAGQEGVRKVLVRVYEEDATAVIEVEDNGPGLPKVIRDNLFEPFQTTKLKGQGTGLGLSLCRRFVEGHGGRIVHSDRPGGGTIFRIVLPLALSARPAIVAG
jgi:C4-dicarboxylate-specific signal transduction histidine kinase